MGPTNPRKYILENRDQTLELQGCALGSGITVKVEFAMITRLDKDTSNLVTQEAKVGGSGRSGAA